MPMVDPRGTVTKWFDTQGYGFIKPDDGGRDVFCHQNALDGGVWSLKVGDYVEFGTILDDDGNLQCCRAWRVAAPEPAAGAREPGQ
jgi:cold shock CspA family protein